MSRLNITNRVPDQYNRQSEFETRSAIQVQLNNLSEGLISAVSNATSAAPTTGSYNVGDFVRNSTPSELGSAGSKYVIYGWMATSSSPLAFVQCRFLTGN